MGRLTIRTENGAALKLDNPQNETEARKQLHDKYLIAIEKLAHYEDLEEANRLIELPCAVGDTVWDIAGKKIREQVIDGIEYRPKGFFIYANEDEWLGMLGELVFLTKEEAEAKLKELENGKKKNNKGRTQTSL